MREAKYVLDSCPGLHFTSLALPDLPLTQPKALGMQRAKQEVKCIMYYLLAVYRDGLVSLARHFLIVFLLL